MGAEASADWTAPASSPQKSELVGAENVEADVDQESANSIAMPAFISPT
jgi:hypothetical protein